MPASSDTAAATESLIESFREAAFYPHSPSTVREIQTHISWVFIVPPFVYKVKKPLDLGFLDFTSLESRRHYCEQEVWLNRRLCPDVYLGVVPLSQTDDGVRLDDDSNVVEYAVKMRELSGSEFARDLVEQGHLAREHIDRIVEKLTRFYNEETSSPEIAEWGRIEKLKSARTRTSSRRRTSPDRSSAARPSTRFGSTPTDSTTRMPGSSTNVAPKVEFWIAPATFTSSTST